MARRPTRVTFLRVSHSGWMEEATGRLCGTRCAHEGDCTQSLPPQQVLAIAVILLAPIALAALLPCAEKSPHKSKTWPHVCAASGLGNAVGALVLAVVPTFFLLLAAPDPCSTALGGCSSISCACGTYYAQGYVFMFSVLLLISILLVREVASFEAATPRHRLLRALMSIGSTGILLTAIYPEANTKDAASYGKNDNFAALYRFAFSLHATGLALTCTIMCALPFVCVCVNWRRFASSASFSRLLFPRLVHLASAFAYAIAFATVREHNETSNYCSPITSATECNAWPVLSPVECLTLESMVGYRPHPYRCKWVNNTLSDEERLLLPEEYVLKHEGVCEKKECRLFQYSRSIALEFGALLLVSTYAITYGLADARMLTSLSASYDALGGLGVTTISEPPILQPLRAALN